MSSKVSALNGGTPFTGLASTDLVDVVDVSDTSMAASGTNKPVTLDGLFSHAPVIKVDTTGQTYTTHTDPRGTTTTSANLLVAPVTDPGFTSPFQVHAFETSFAPTSDPGAKACNGTFSVLGIPSGNSTAKGSMTLRGLNFIVNNLGTGAIGTVIGAGGNFINAAAATVTTAYGLTAQILNNASGATITTAHGVHVYSPANVSGATMTNTAGLYIEAQTAGAGTQTNAPWAIYQSGSTDQNFLGGRTNLGATASRTFYAPLLIHTHPQADLGAGGVAGLKVITAPTAADASPIDGDFVSIYALMTSDFARDRIWAFNPCTNVLAGVDATAWVAEFDLNNDFAEPPEPNAVGHKNGVMIASGGTYHGGSALDFWAASGSSRWKYALWFDHIGGLTGACLGKISPGGNVSVDYGFDFRLGTFNNSILAGPNNKVMVAARNAANTTDVPLIKLDASDNILIGNQVVLDSQGNLRATSFTGATQKNWTLQQDPGQPTGSGAPGAGNVVKVGISSAVLGTAGVPNGASVAALSDSTGQYLDYTSGTTANTSEAGWELPTTAPTVPIMQFQWNSISTLTMKTGPAVTAQRVYCGWFSADPMAADITNAIHAMGFRMSSTTLGPVTVSNGGTNYTTPPAVAFTGGTFTTTATAVAIMGLESLALTAAGANYVDGTYLNQPMDGGGGTGATFNFVVSGGAVQTTAQNAASMVVNQAGTGYTTTPTPNFGNASGTGATGTSKLKVVTVSTTGGSGYTVNHTGVTFTGGAGSGAAASTVLGGAWHCLVGNGTTQLAIDALTVAAADTRYVLRIDASGGTSIKFFINGVLVATATTNLPGASTSLIWHSNLRVTTTTAKQLRLSSLKVEQE